MCSDTVSKVYSVLFFVLFCFANKLLRETSSTHASYCVNKVQCSYLFDIVRPFCSMRWALLTSGFVSPWAFRLHSAHHIGSKWLEYTAPSTWNIYIRLIKRSCRIPVFFSFDSICYCVDCWLLCVNQSARFLLFFSLIVLSLNAKDHLHLIRRIMDFFFDMHNAILINEVIISDFSNESLFVAWKTRNYRKKPQKRNDNGSDFWRFHRINSKIICDCYLLALTTNQKKNNQTPQLHHIMFFSFPHKYRTSCHLTFISACLILSVTSAEVDPFKVVPFSSRLCDISTHLSSEAIMLHKQLNELI